MIIQQGSKNTKHIENIVYGTLKILNVVYGVLRFKTSKKKQILLLYSVVEFIGEQHSHLDFYKIAGLKFNYL